MNEIDIISTIKRKNLDEKNYFNSLLEAAYEEKMITETDILNLQIQILQLLDESELNEIYLMLENKDKSKVVNIINQVYEEICNELIIDNKELKSYIKKNLSSIIEIITNAVRQKTLDKVFIPQKYLTIC